MSVQDEWNQAPAFAGYNAWANDAALRSAIERWDAAWVADEADRLGALVGSEHFQSLARAADRHAPELQTHDRFGERLDAVEYHPAYHALMSFAFEAGLHSLAWTAQRPGAFAARAALNYLWNQGENGTACPVTMTFAGVHMMRKHAGLASGWEPKLLARAYDPRPLPLRDKRAVTLGMAMTERQGGSDLRAVRTRASPEGGTSSLGGATFDGGETSSRGAETFGGGESFGEGETFILEGHKWFCSAPMSDGFFTLARSDAGVTCYFVPRILPDGRRNPFLLQRLKDKCGNRSNASAEIEYRGTRAWRIGEDGRGIATLIEMTHLTRYDIVVASAGMMRSALAHALHHARHRVAFGRRLADQALMQNVLADLALESEAACLIAFRLSAAFDRAAQDERERHLMRLLTPVAKYWLCKRSPVLTVEAMECLGGNGYVEESPMARFYREAPVNGIWEGSGNVIGLDVARSLGREPASALALLDEIRQGGERLAPMHRELEALLRGAPDVVVMRRFIERAALAVQASLLERYAPAEVADAFFKTRLEGDGGRHFGTLPAGTAFGPIMERALPV